MTAEGTAALVKLAHAHEAGTITGLWFGTVQKPREAGDALMMIRAQYTVSHVMQDKVEGIGEGAGGAAIDCLNRLKMAGVAPLE